MVSSLQFTFDIIGGSESLGSFTWPLVGCQWLCLRLALTSSIESVRTVDEDLSRESSRCGYF